MNLILSRIDMQCMLKFSVTLMTIFKKEKIIGNFPYLLIILKNIVILFHIRISYFLASVPNKTFELVTGQMGLCIVHVI